MFEKVSQLAEQAAANVSRRQFLGRLGRDAAAAAAALGGLLAFPTVAMSGRRIRRCSLDGPTCGGQLVGSPCPGQPRGHCKPCDPSDKSLVVDCCCRRRGPGK